MGQISDESAWEMRQVMQEDDRESPVEREEEHRAESSENVEAVDPSHPNEYVIPRSSDTDNRDDGSNGRGEKARCLDGDAVAREFSTGRLDPRVGLFYPRA